MSYSENIAYQPEKFGLEFHGSLDLEDEPYQFYIVGVWEGPEGFYISTDSGCSCPSPWENHMSMEDLTGPLTREQAHEEITSLWNNSYYKGSLPERDLEQFLASF
jgi:hypothetical protein